MNSLKREATTPKERPAAVRSPSRQFGPFSVSNSASLELLEDVVELLFLGLEVTLILPVRLYLERYPLGDLKPEALQSHDLGEIVGHKADARETEVFEDQGADAVVPE